MKKAAVFLMILTLSVSSAACGNKEKDDNQADAKTEQSQNADNSKDNDKSDSITIIKKQMKNHLQNIKHNIIQRGDERHWK